jgi:signal transduction histidine kinase/DNA-binding response OmpR family regulator
MSTRAAEQAVTARPDSSPVPKPDPLAGGGEMGALMRSIDWSQTAVGAVSSWPQSLRTALSILLETGFPMYIAWGPEFTQFYNDGYRPILGSTKHPAAMGRSTRQTFAEIWDIIGPMFQGVLQGTATTLVDFLLPLDRHGFVEECYFIFSYSPIREEGGSVGGVLVTVTETTERVLGARRLRTLQELAAKTQEAATAESACAAAAEVLGENPADLPFALLYLLAPDGRSARLAGAAGMPAGSPASPLAIDLGADHATDDSPWPLAAVVASGAARLVEELPAGFDRLDAGGDPPRSRRALVLPIARPGAARPAGVLVAAASPRLSLDESYRSFLALVAGEIATAIANARALAEARAQAAALAEIDRAKTAFFSNVSHEFRTPLTLILGPTEDALGQAALPPPERERWQLVHRNALRLLKLVNTLLDFSRLEAGRVEASYEPTDLGALTRDLASVFQSAIERAGLRLELDVEPLGEAVLVDREMWEKIVLNLLSNALKFTFAGEIGVALRRVGDRAVLTIRDTGTGIAAEQVPLLFDRFHRVPGARSRTHEGTGIGLALVQELVGLHGGTVAVASVVDRGTAFTVTLPFGSAHLPAERLAAARSLTSTAIGAAPFVEEALRWSAGAAAGTPAPVMLPTAAPAAALPVPPAAGPAAATRRTPPQRVLVADDNTDMREYVSRLLGERWEVEAVADGAAALARAREWSPDLILSDIMMPGLDGYQLLRALRADEPTRGIPVIFLSARAGEESRLEGLEAGADDYLVKPFSGRELLARVGTHLEISRLRTEADRARRRLYSQLMQAPVPVCIMLGPTLVYDLANPLYERMVGRSAFVGKPIREVFPELPADAAIFRTLTRVYTSGEPFTADEFLVPLDRQGDGAVEDAFFQFTAQPMRDAAGEVFGIMAVAVDVTSQVRARREVEASRNLLETVVNQMPAGVIVAAAPSGRTLLANERVREILGHPPLPTASIGDFVAYGAEHADGSPFAAGEYTLARALAGEMVSDQEILYRCPDGTLHTLSASAAPVYGADGRIVAAVNAFSDISDRKRADAERQQLLVLEREARAQAEIANRSKDEFLAMLGHELRNPLAPIVTALQLMRLRGDVTLQKERTIIERQVSHLVRLVDDLLDVSRVTRGKIELKRQRIELSEIVAQAIEMASPLIEERRHRLTLDVPRQGLLVEADAGRLAQVVSNLLNNAAKYSEPHGAIVVSAARQGGEVVLAVRDSGIGLSPEILPHIFDLFVQERQALDRAQGGLGLGLAIARVLVELHGGMVGARSEGPGRGSEFVVRLPAAPPIGRPVPADERGIAIRPDALRVLVVDDNIDIAELLAESVRLLGHVAQAAHDGLAGLRLAARLRPDLALLDIGLPVMDGYELARNLRAMPGLESIRLVAVTGYTQEEDERRGATAGFEQHLVKPIRLEQLEALLTRRLPAGR